MKVIPKDDTIRNLIRHPIAGAFRSEGSSDWPDDTFTARRIADGDITVEEEAPPEGDAVKKEEEKSDRKSRARTE